MGMKASHPKEGRSLGSFLPDVPRDLGRMWASLSLFIHSFVYLENTCGIGAVPGHGDQKPWRCFRILSI